MKSFFILGSNPTLSIAEIAAVLGYDLDVSEASREVLLIETDENLGELMDRLGGTIKAGQIIGSMRNLNTSELADLIAATVAETRGKVNYGLSTYNLDVRANGRSPLHLDLVRQLEPIGLEVKKRLKEQKRSARFVYNKEPVLSSGSIRENKLLESGGEYVLIAGPDGVQIGQTAAVQDFEAWSHRDYDKPARDMKRGMIPPKLARMMVNIALGAPPPFQGGDGGGSGRTEPPFNPPLEKGGESKITLLDPFCGVGTILMEARIVGVDFVIGSDIDEVAIEATSKNLNWFSRRSGVDVSSAHMFTCDAQKIDTCLPPFSRQLSRGGTPPYKAVAGQKGVAKPLTRDIDTMELDTLPPPWDTGEECVDVVVTEPYLGPPQTGKETQAELDKITKELTDLYLKSFKAIKKTLKSGSRLVIALPVFRNNTYMPVPDEFKKMGLSVVDPVPVTAPSSIIKKTPRGGILYMRKDQLVGREILLLKYQ